MNPKKVRQITTVLQRSYPSETSEGVHRRVANDICRIVSVGVDDTQKIDYAGDNDETSRFDNSQYIQLMEVDNFFQQNFTQNIHARTSKQQVYSLYKEYCAKNVVIPMNYFEFMQLIPDTSKTLEEIIGWEFLV